MQIPACPDPKFMLLSSFGISMASKICGEFRKGADLRENHESVTFYFDSHPLFILKSNEEFSMISQWRFSH